MNLRALGIIASGMGIALAGACSLAGLDDYAKGTSGGAGPGGAGGQGTGGQNTGGQGTGGVTSCDVCDEVCVDLATDPEHCGTCGHACAAQYGCTKGVCGNAVVDVSTMLASCAALENGELWCWGRNVWGEVGIPPAQSDSTCPFHDNRCQATPVRVAGISGVVEVSAGAEATCARTGAGEVYCWGSNGKSLLGHNPQTDPVCDKAGGPDNGSHGRCSPVPQKVALPAGVVAAQIAVGTAVACARTTAKDVYCWGRNTHGEVRAPVGGSFWQPEKNANVNGDAEEIAVSLDLQGDYSTVCYRQSTTNAVRCWGASENGILFPKPSSSWPCGDGCDPAAHDVPQVWKTLSGQIQGQQIQIGYITGAALNQGGVMVWGDDSYGQNGGLSTGSTNHFDPAPLPGVPAVTSVSMRFLTTLMIDQQKNVWVVGWGDEGQTGLGSYPTTACPLGNGQRCVNTATKVPGLTGIVKVHGSANNSAAIDDQGKLWMWGSNYTASLGHAPGTAGDGACATGSEYLCNPTPAVVTIPP